MYFISERNLEAELEIEVRDLPNSDGKIVPVRAYRYVWREFDRIINTTDVDPFDLIEVADTYANEHGDPWGEAFKDVVLYFRDKYVLGLDP